MSLNSYIVGLIEKDMGEIKEGRGKTRPIFYYQRVRVGNRIVGK